MGLVDGIFERNFLYNFLIQPGKAAKNTTLVSPERIQPQHLRLRYDTLTTEPCIAPSFRACAYTTSSFVNCRANIGASRSIELNVDCLADTIFKGKCTATSQI
jgi:hypothetical protein